MREVASLDANAGAFVIACFSDPGLHVLREITKRPVSGISEAGVLTALTMGQRIGVIAILAASAEDLLVQHRLQEQADAEGEAHP